MSAHLLDGDVFRYPDPRDCDLIHYRKLALAGLRRWTAVGCLLLVLLRLGVGATHLHADASASQTSDHCVICIHVQSNASATAFYQLPILRVLEIVSLPYQTESKSGPGKTEFLIRPPPRFQKW